jgi:YD repeat-containing protein
MGDMLRFDAERLRILLERHHLHTGSKQARALLDDWGQCALRKFVKVMPRDYKRTRAASRLEAERARRGASVAGRNKRRKYQAEYNGQGNRLSRDRPQGRALRSRRSG